MDMSRVHLQGDFNSGQLTINTKNITVYSNIFISLSFQILFYAVFQLSYRISTLLIQCTNKCFSKTN